MGGELAKTTAGEKVPKNLVTVSDAGDERTPRITDNSKRSGKGSPSKSPLKVKAGDSRKRNEKIIITAKNKPKQSQEKKALELIQKNNREKKDYDMLYEIINKHFFMQNLTAQAKEEIIITMSLCKVKEGTTLCKQGSLGSYWYIVSEGTLDESIDEVYTKSIERGQSFGEIALMNDAVRNSTIKAKTDCNLWVLKREAFRKVIDFLFQMNFDENMKFLNSITLPLDNAFKTLLASNLLEEVYPACHYICKTGEEGNCMYIVKEGEINCQIGDKVIRTLVKGDNFGQKAILFAGKRTLDVKTKTPCKVYSISVEFFKNQLGENYKEALFFSFIRLAFQKSTYFNQVTEKMLLQIHHLIQIKNYSKGEIIYKKDDNISSKLCIVLEGNIEDKQTGQVYAKRNEFLFEKDMMENKQMTTPHDMVAEPDCLVAFIDYEEFKKLLGGVATINKKATKEISFKNIKIFRNLREEKLDLIEKAMVLEKFENGKKIINQGEIGDKFYIIKSGRVDFFVNSKYVRSLSENEEFGERALIISEKRSATAISNGKVEVYSLTSEVFKSILEPNLREYFKKKFQLEDTSVELKDLDAIQELGKGNFGFVYLVRNKKNKNCSYAIKAMSLKQIKKEKLEPCVELEKNVLLKIDHPFIMKMIKYMKNDKYIFFLNEFIHGKEMWEVIRDIGLLSKEQTQFYIGSILLAIEYLHNKKIVYRDIKPENVMVNDDGYIKVIDFGTVKEIKERTNTIIGTPHYMAPEIIKGEGYSFQVDVWSIAICMYEFYCGRLPFGEDCEEPIDVYKAVARDDLTFPSFVTDQTFINLLNKLLKKNPLNRLTKISKIKEDPYFSNFDWGKLISFEIEPPYRIKFKKETKQPLNVPYIALLKTLDKDDDKPKRKPSQRQIDFDKWLKNF